MEEEHVKEHHRATVRKIQTGGIPTAQRVQFLHQIHCKVAGGGGGDVKETCRLRSAYKTCQSTGMCGPYLNSDFK